jgi:hypothetical protein
MVPVQEKKASYWLTLFKGLPYGLMGEYETCFWLIEGDTIQGFALQYYCE